MSRSEISKFLWLHLLWTFLLSELFTVLIILIFFPEDKQGPEIEAGQAVSILVGVGLSLGFTLCSLSVFFNLDPLIARNRWYSLITYFFLPLIALTWLCMLSQSAKATVGLVAVTSPFFIVHTWFYLQFRKRLNSGM